ncbi:MAG: hypothetical protein Tsb0010_04730 [Parvularculaceae bacterium]
MDCTAPGHFRSIRIVESGADGVACAVWYRASESEDARVLWSARHSTDFCRSKADELIAKLTNSGFSCAAAADSPSAQPARAAVRPEPSTQSAAPAAPQFGAAPASRNVEAEPVRAPRAPQGAQTPQQRRQAAATPRRPAAREAETGIESQPVPADSENSVIDAIKHGKPILDVRYRLESKKQQGFGERATASTIRTRFGYETAEIFDFKLLFEFENVAAIGADRFNSTTNGRAAFPVIADPDATEINRAQITYSGIEKTPITIGRQRFNLNNHRFVGAVDFRQNQQTFDALRLSSTFVDNLSVDYLYISRVHRIFGDDHPAGEFDSDSHIISASYNAGEFGVIKAYGVLLDLMEAPALSSASWGVRYENALELHENSKARLALVGEFAAQRDYASNPFDYDENYFHGEATLAFAPFSATVGYEGLGGNGAIGFSTPLATLHKFQGFADVFLATPATGVEDIYGTIRYAWSDAPLVAGATLYATYHDFESGQGNADFGEEVDAGLTIKLDKHWSADLKGAVYNGSGVFADRSLIWAALRFQY